MPSAANSPICWVISDGRRGIENQALGLAEAMSRSQALRIQTQIIDNQGLFKALPPRLQYMGKVKPGDYGLAADLPDLAIGCGRQAIAPLLALKKAGVFTVYVQSPRIGVDNFDLVVAPAHDGLANHNVHTMIGSPNRITDAILQTAQADFSSQLKHYPNPRVCVLVGGQSKTHRLGASTLAEHLALLNGLVETGHSLLITTSRRTPDFARKAYKEFADKHDCIWGWDGDGENPYFAFLAGADAILVTEDSTNMLTEACATGTPVYTLAMDGRPGKFSHLYDKLKTVYGVVPFMGALDLTPRSPLRETDRAAAAVWAAMQKRG